MTDTSHPVRSVAHEVVAAQGGDRDAFGRLYQHYQPMVHAVILAHADRADVDDLVHEVFARALVAIRSVRDPDAIGGWLCSMARNEARMRGRVVKRLAPLEDNTPAATPHPEVQLDADRALQAIRTLPEAYKEPLLLRLVYGMSGPEIAERMGMTHGALRVNLHRGMSLLRSTLGVELP